MGSTLFRDPQARSSTLATLRTLQPRAFGSLNRIDPLDLVSNYYLSYYYLPKQALHSIVTMRKPGTYGWMNVSVYMCIYGQYRHHTCALATNASSKDNVYSLA